MKRKSELICRAVVVGIVIAALIAQYAHVMAKPQGDGDFRVHHRFGLLFRTHQFIYPDTKGFGPLEAPYPPAWAMLYAPLSLLPMKLAFTLIFPFLVLAGWIVLRILDRYSRGDLPVSETARFWISVAAIALAGQYLLRDLVEAGLSLMMLAAMLGAADLSARRRNWAGGLLLGFITAVKLMPGLFILYFAIKRRWAMTAIAVAATGVFTVLPMEYEGRAEYAMEMHAWLGHVRDGLTKADAVSGIPDQDNVRNMSLRPALGALLPGVPPATAGSIVRAIMLIALVMIGIALAHSSLTDHRPPTTDHCLIWEWAIVLLLILLYSPITWTQHCVYVLPACYLLVRTLVAGRPLARWTYWALGIFILFNCLLTRDVVQKQISLLLFGWHVQTWGIVTLLLTALAARRRLLATQPRD